jgi:hypothetical protein
MPKIILFLLLLFVVSTKSIAQSDSLIIEKSDSDTVLLKSYATRYNPRKALLYAAILPGLGQVYNKKYWKVPLVYGGFIWIGFFVNDYHNKYIHYKTMLFQKLENGQLHPQFREEQLRNTVSNYRRERDFMIILMGGMYILQIIDAHVDAHLKEFDLNPNLQVKLKPSMDQNVYAGRTTGVSLVFQFK